MRKLCRANFARLWKDKTFWTGTLFMFGLGIFVAVSQYSDIVRYKMQIYFDNTLMTYVLFAGCCSAVFCSMFTGTEYSEGIIRNKLIVGHLRSSIYLSDWITSIAAALIMTAAFLLSYCTLGSVLLEPPMAGTEEMVFMVCISMVTVIAYVSVFSMITMLVTRKATAAVFCLLIFFGLLIMAMVIKGKLDAPEFISSYTMTIDGVEQSSPEPNPKYLQPAARKVYQFFLDVLPTGQSLQLSAFCVIHPYLMMLYSVVISAGATFLGILGLRKKNIK